MFNSVFNFRRVTLFGRTGLKHKWVQLSFSFSLTKNYKTWFQFMTSKQFRMENKIGIIILCWYLTTCSQPICSIFKLKNNLTLFLYKFFSIQYVNNLNWGKLFIDNICVLFHKNLQMVTKAFFMNVQKKCFSVFKHYKNCAFNHPKTF